VKDATQRTSLPSEMLLMHTTKVLVQQACNGTTSVLKPGYEHPPNPVMLKPVSKYPWKSVLGTLGALLSKLGCCRESLNS
jgi:hypothetical protein